MDSTLVRIGLVVAVVLGASLIALWSRRRTSFHPPIDIVGAGFEPGLVVFTSTECTRCKPVLEAAKATGAPLREVTYEIEPTLQERVGVVGVPLTVVVDRQGRVSSQLPGEVSSPQLRRALERAGF